MYLGVNDLNAMKRPLNAWLENFKMLLFYSCQVFWPTVLMTKVNTVKFTASANFEVYVIIVASTQEISTILCR